ncbi:MAG: hypothetical protein WDW38_008200 [Sanguina aurantia]
MLAVLAVEAAAGRFFQELRLRARVGDRLLHRPKTRTGTGVQLGSWGRACIDRRCSSLSDSQHLDQQLASRSLEDWAQAWHRGVTRPVPPVLTAARYPLQRRVQGIQTHIILQGRGGFGA